MPKSRRALARAVRRPSDSGEAGASHSEPHTAGSLNGWWTKLLRSCSTIDRQQPIELFLHDRIALAGARLEATAIEHSDTSAAVLDQAGALQVAGSFRDTLAAYAQHVGDQLLRHDELISHQSVETQQQ